MGQTEVDGVPTFWSRCAGELRAGLVFRVGQADERLARRGITHLVEHLALHAMGDRPDHVNGMVDLTTTRFTTVGTEQEVTDFLASVCRSLRDLPTDRLELENQVLTTEADSTGGQSAATTLAIWRYGAATYGLCGYEEFGVGHHTPDELRQWAGTWFTRDNAVLWLVGGPPPANLRLDQPAGQRFPPPAPSSTLPRTPAYFPAPVAGVAGGTVVDRSTAARAYAELLRHRLHERLRMAEGISYGPITSYDRRDGRTAQITAFADGLAPVFDRLVNGFVEVVDQLADEPPTEAEVAQVVHLIRPPLSEPDTAANWVVGTAHAELFGIPRPSLTDLVSELDGLTPDDLRATAAEARDNMLLMVPSSHRPPGNRYRPAPCTSDGTVDGQVFLSLASRGTGGRRTIGPGNDSRARLAVGPSGISLVEGPAFMTVRFDQCEAMLAWPDGARHLIGRDGLHLRVEPTMWRDGRALPGLLDHGVPPAVVLGQPHRAPDEIPQPPHVSSWDRLLVRFRRT